MNLFPLSKSFRPSAAFSTTLLIGLLFFTLPLSLAKAADDARDKSSNRLELVKISALKRELRVPTRTGHASEVIQKLSKLYDENRFSDILEHMNAEGAKDASAEQFLYYGNGLYFLGKEEDAIRAYQVAFRLAQKPQQKAAAFANVGLIFSRSGRWKEAISWMDKALLIDRAEQDWEHQGLALSQLGDFYFQLGDTQKGASAHIEALEISETIPIPWLEGRQLNQLANLYYLDGTQHIAEDYFQKSIKLYKGLDQPLGLARALEGLSFVEKETKEVQKSLAHLTDALRVYEDLDYPQKQAQTLVNMALIHRDQSRYSKALALLASAKKIQEGLEDMNALGEIEGTIGTVYEKKGALSDALRHLTVARNFFEKAKASQQIHIVDLRLQRLKDQLN